MEVEVRSGQQSAETLFWKLVEPMYADPAVTRSTMMGLPCIRVDGNFFAALSRDRQLLVKLPAARVAELVASGDGRPFAPNGRTFRAWVAFTDPDEAAWRMHLADARAFVAALPRS